MEDVRTEAAGKINIWVGEADHYFLNNTVHLLDEFLSKANPLYGGRIFYGPGKGHCWLGLTETQMMEEMAAAIEKSGLEVLCTQRELGVFSRHPQMLS